jgi:predicted outer membrane repeat protein
MLRQPLRISHFTIHISPFRDRIAVARQEAIHSIAMRALLLLCLQLTFCVASLGQSIIYVTETGSGDATGTSWENALPGTSLAERIAGAESDTHFWIAGGLYRPTTTTDRTIAFAPKAGVSLYGGFEGTEQTIDDRPDNSRETILSGNIGDLASITDNSQHVVLIQDAEHTITLDRLSIRDGYLVPVGNDNAGAGICVLLTKPALNLTLNDCQLSSNTAIGASSGGGGLFVGGSSHGNLTLRNCLFQWNVAGGTGGGLLARTDEGGSVATVIEDCIFRSNTSLDQSGAIAYRGVMASPRSSLTIRHAQFAYNLAGTLAGAVTPGANSCLIEACIFEKNGVTSGNGGAIDGSGSLATYLNCLFAKNNATLGGAVYSTSEQLPTQQTFTNCHFVQNAATVAGGAFYNTQFTDMPTGTPSVVPNVFQLTNSLVWGNSAPDSPTYKLFQSETASNLPFADYSLIEGYTPDTYFGNNNLSTDPLFIDAANGDYRLQKGSPAIDAGTLPADSPTTDLLGKKRINGPIDIGAYEFECTASACIPFVVLRKL